MFMGLEGSGGERVGYAILGRARPGHRGAVDAEHTCGGVVVAWRVQKWPAVCCGSVSLNGGGGAEGSGVGLCAVRCLGSGATERRGEWGMGWEWVRVVGVGWESVAAVCGVSWVVSWEIYNGRYGCSGAPWE